MGLLIDDNLIPFSGLVSLVAEICKSLPQILSKPFFAGRCWEHQNRHNGGQQSKGVWEKTDIWPTSAEQTTLVSVPGGDIRHFSRFCPEVSFERFGLFATDLHKYTDEIDVGNAHKVLRREEASPDDWRWNWWDKVECKQ